jgi:pimeloyl-ACP methyl ester carboxylesterase
MEACIPSGSLDMSVDAMREAMEMTGSTVVIGYSLGGTIAALYASRGHGTEDVAYVLIAPFLSYSPMQAILKYMSPLLPHTQHGIPVMYRGIVDTINVAEYERTRLPILREVQTITLTDVSHSFIRATCNAIDEIRTSPPRIDVNMLAIVPIYDEVIQPTETSATVTRQFAGAHVVDVACDHWVWPCLAADDMAIVYNHMTSFLMRES